MDYRQFFTNNTWWGKLIGAFLGYLIAGPTGAFFGVLIGNFFDRGLAEHFSKPHWSYHSERRKEVQKHFFKATFLVLGYIAKSDGRVSEHEIQATKKLMQEMGLSAAQRKLAQEYFNEGKQKQFDLDHTLILLQQACHDNRALLNLFVDIQYRVACVDGLSLEKQNALNVVLDTLGFATLNKQYQFYENFSYDYKQRQQYRHQQSSHAHHTKINKLEHAYGILGIPATASKQEVKRAYRRLISRNHPDKLIAQGLPDELIKIANEKTQKIRKAYEQICETKGW